MCSTFKGLKKCHGKFDVNVEGQRPLEERDREELIIARTYSNTLTNMKPTRDLKGLILEATLPPNLQL